MKKYYIICFICLILFPNLVLAKEKIKLDSCVDGDTAKFIINNETKIVRFLAINTEESVSSKSVNTFMGQVASLYTCFRLKTARKIEIEYDDNAAEEDKYNRKLGWIFVDDTLLQKDLVIKGFAKVAYLYDDYKYTEQLEKAEATAETANIGVWNNNNYLAKIYNFVQKAIKLFT